jgi:uncharacterized protein
VTWDILTTIVKRIYLLHSFIDARLVVGKSKIEGKGILAVGDIKKGERIMEWGGRKVLQNKFDQNVYRLQSAAPIDDDYFLATLTSDNIVMADEYLNHSCDPNAWLIDEVTVVARRDIKKGEEVTVDCATWDCDTENLYTDDGLCKCASKTCRKVLSPNDWQRKDLQVRYKGHFSPYIQKKIMKSH